MKKILLVIISFFLMIPSVSAAYITSSDVEIVIDELGDAAVTEKWVIREQDGEKYLEKYFNGIENAKVTDFKIEDIHNSIYEKVDKLNDKMKFSYQVEEKSKGKKKKYKFTILEEDNVFTLSYKVKGMIKKYTDIEGFDWLLVAKTKGQEIGQLNVTIKTPVALNETNTALYGIGENLSVSFKDGAIHLFATNVGAYNSLRLMTTFNGQTFKNAHKVDMTFKEYYDEVLNANEFIEELKDLLSETTTKVVIGLIVALLIGLGIYKIVLMCKTHDEYSGIITENNLTIDKVEEIKYYDSIPCNGDFYKIAFLAGYFKITKNRSNLIGAMLLKWIYEGNARVNSENGRPYFKLLPNQRFERKLDNDLYDMLMAASSHTLLEGTKLTRYANEHYLRVITWFNMGFNEAISDEYAKGNIKKTQQLGQTKIVLNEKMVEEANKIQGLKRYLLNFNQVPRQTELTEQGYKYILVAAELLGIGIDVAKEILRKNPDNIMAKQLLEVEQARSIFKGVYETALTPYKQTVKNKSLNLAYDPNFDALVQQKREHEEIVERRSRI